MTSTGGARVLAAVVPVLALVAAVLQIVADRDPTRRFVGGTMAFEQVVVAEGDQRPPNPHGKAVGDLDGDGYRDIVVAASTTGPMVWYRERPDGSGWTTHTIRPSGAWSTEMRVGDVDGDGDLDVVVPHRDALRWYENPRPVALPQDVTSWTERTIGVEGGNNHDVALGDLNGDGRLDVVSRPKAFRNSVPAIYLWLQTLTGWQRLTITTDLRYKGEGADVGDIDGDGDLDIAANGYWLENRVGGTDWSAVHAVDPVWFHPVHENDDPDFQSYVAVTIADATGDGHADIVIGPSERYNGYLTVYDATSPRTGPNGAWRKTTVDTGVSFLHGTRAADMDGDGDVDLVTAEAHQITTLHGATSRVMVYLNPRGSGSTEWRRHLVATTGSHNLQVGDFDNDGDIDIMGVNWGTDGTGGQPAPDGAKVYLWRNVLVDGARRPALDSWQRRVIGTHENSGTDPDEHGLFVLGADLDGDGDTDLVSGPNVFRNPGTIGATWTRSTVGAGFENVAAIHDIDGDGRLDLIGTDTATVSRDVFHELVWARNDGDGTFTVFRILGANDGDHLRGIAIERFHDGKLAVALSWHRPANADAPEDRLGQTPGVYLLTVPDEPAADATWPKELIADVTQNEQLSAADIDRDGRVDLLTGTSWLRNTATGWVPTSLLAPPTGSEQPDRNRLVDVDNDGRLDAVVGFQADPTTDELAPLVWFAQPAVATDPWTVTEIAAELKGPMSLDARDLDGDGDTDVVVGEHDLRAGAQPRLLVFENVDGTQFRQHTVFAGDDHNSGAQALDLDGDGDVDLVSVGWSNADVAVYENLARTAGTTTTTTTSSSTTSSSSSTTTAPAPNLAPNPGFESDPATHYFTYGTGTFTWASDSFWTGARSLKITSTTSSTSLARWLSRTTIIAAEPGKTYRASVFMRTSAVANKAALAINFWDASSKHLGTVESLKLSSTNNWRLLTVEGTAPAGTRSIRVEFRLYGSGAIWADDVTINRV